MPRFSALVVAVSLLLATPALADEKGSEEQDPAGRAREAVEMLLQQLQDLLHAIPLYGKPYVDDDGNIVIPRLPREAPEDKEKKDGEPPVVEET